MAKETYIGANGLARKIKGGYVGVTLSTFGENL